MFFYHFSSVILAGLCILFISINNSYSMLCLIILSILSIVIGWTIFFSFINWGRKDNRASNIMKLSFDIISLSFILYIFYGEVGVEIIKTGTIGIIFLGGVNFYINIFEPFKEKLNVTKDSLKFEK